MKHVSLLFVVLFCAVTVSAQTLVPVTFRVNMRVKILEQSFVPQEGDWVRVAASFNNWGSSNDTLSKEPAPNDSIYRVTKSFLEGDTLDFKYAKTFRRGVSAEHVTRGYRVPVGGGTVPLAYFDNDTVVDTLVQGNVTFRVDMRPLASIGWFLPAVDTVQVRGEFNSWLGERMTLSPLSGLYALTRPYSGEPYQETKFKYYLKLDVNTANARFPNWQFVSDFVQYEQLYQLGGGGVRAFNLPLSSGNITVGPYRFSDISENATMLNVSDTCRVTLRVNMGPAMRYVDPFNPATDAVYVSWSDYAWALNQAANQGSFSLQQRMTRDSPTDSVWSISFKVKGKTHAGLMYVYQFRHAVGGSVTEGGGGGVLNPYRVRYILPYGPNWFPASYTAPLDIWQKNPPMPVEPPQGTESVGEDLDNQTIPRVIVLHQNFPNPFNPSTRIRYSIPRSTHVRLSVFDIVGQQVAELVNDSQERGNYVATFDANKLASGVYLCRLEAGGFSQTKKMLLMR